MAKREMLTMEEKELQARFWFYRTFTVIGCLLLLAALVYLFRILSTPMSILVWTIIFVFCLRGTVNKFCSRGMNRILATVCAYVILLVVLFLVMLLLFSPVFGFGDQFAALLEGVPAYVQSVIDWGNGIYNDYSEFLDNDMIRQWLGTASSSLTAWASDLARGSAQGVVNIGTVIVNSAVSIGFGLVIAFWILLELPAMGREMNRLIGDKHREDFEMFHVTFTRVMGGFIKATLIQCACIAVIAAIGFTIIGVPNSLALGAIAGLLNILPVIGGWLAAAVGAIAGFLVAPWVGLVAFIILVAAHYFVYTFISPKLMADSVDIHPILTLFFLMVGASLGGALSGLTGSIVGMLLAIPAVAVAKSVFVYYFEKTTGRRIVAEDGVFFQGAPPVGDIVDPLADAVAAPSDTVPELKLPELTQIIRPDDKAPEAADAAQTAAADAVAAAAAAAGEAPDDE